MRRVTAFAVVLAAHTFVTVAPAPGATAPALAGRTVVAGSRSGSVLVRLPRSVSFDAYADVAIEARGRISGFVLKSQGRWDAPSVQAVNTGFCESAGCRPVWPRESSGLVVSGDSNGSRGTLPAGLYRLFLLADGAPVRVTLTFRGLAGRVTLSPRAGIRAALVEPRPTVAEPGNAPLLFAAGSTWRVGSGGGFTFTAVWKDVPLPEERSAAGTCTYRGVPPAGSSPAYQLPCSGGYGGIPPYVTRSTSDGSPTVTPVGPGRHISFLQSGGIVPPGTFSLGAYHNTAGPVTTAHLQQLWLDF